MIGFSCGLCAQLITQVRLCVARSACLCIKNTQLPLVKPEHCVCRLMAARLVIVRVAQSLLAGMSTQTQAQGAKANLTKQHRREAANQCRSE